LFVEQLPDSTMPLALKLVPYTFIVLKK
jgi:hypothetical protein